MTATDDNHTPHRKLAEFHRFEHAYPPQFSRNRPSLVNCKAYEIIPSRPQDEHYLKGGYLIELRDAHTAQIAKTMSLIHQHYLGYGPDVDILEDEGAYYTASRVIKNLQARLTGFSVSPDCQLLQDGQNYHLTGLATVQAVAYFFGGVDFSKNCGFQIKDQAVRAFHTDNGQALNSQLLDRAITRQDLISFPEINPPILDNKKLDYLTHQAVDKLVRGTAYQRELADIWEKLANTDFAAIKHFFSDHIHRRRQVEGRSKDTQARSWSLDDMHIYQAHESRGPESQQQPELELDALIKLLSKRQLSLRQQLSQQAAPSSLTQFQSTLKSARVYLTEKVKLCLTRSSGIPHRFDS